MRSRGLVVAIAVVLAVLAAVGVIVYTNQVRDEVTTQDTVPVLVANQDIPANTSLDPLIEQGVFEFVRVPETALVAGAVTSQDELVGQSTVAPIFAREQIPTSRLSSGERDVSFQGVSDGHIGVAMSLEAPRGGAGVVQSGDSVAVYATFAEGTPVLRDDLEKLLTPQLIDQFIELQLGGNAPTNTDKAFTILKDTTVTLVPTVKVLTVQNPPVDEQGRRAEGQVSMLLDLLPEDASNVVFANETARLWLGLLPPSDAETGYDDQVATIGIDYDRLVGVVKP
jgi:Flp pilus assembly protein CpaB